MTVDRRSHDPYAPHPSRNASRPQPPTSTPPAATGTEVELEDLPKADLIDLAAEHGVPAYGTKADIATRIRDALST